MVDRFYCLRHNTIICCYYKNSDICRTCSTHTHCCERLMSWSIQECDLLSVDFYNIRTNVLCDTTGLTVNNIGMTDRIQKRSFTMVNVTHNTDYRRTFLHFLFVLFVFLQKFFDYIYNFFLLTQDIEFQCDLFCCLVIDFLVYSSDLALHKQLFHDHRWYDLHLVCQFFDCQNFRDCDLFDLFFYLLLFLLWFLKLLLRLVFLLTLWHSFFIITTIIFLLVIVFSLSILSLWFLSFDCRSRNACVISSVIFSVI